MRNSLGKCGGLLLSFGLIASGCSPQPAEKPPEKSAATQPTPSKATGSQPTPPADALEIPADNFAKKDETTAGSDPTETSPVSAETSPNPPADPPVLLTENEIREGWIALFDGHSLFGWKPNSDANWSVQDGVITADSGNPGLLLTPVRFADFELRCDYRLAKGGNSGIFLRTPFKPTDPTKDCYELNMCDSHPAFPTGSLVGRAKPTEKLDGEEKWLTYYVRCVAKKVTVQLDGKTVLDFEDSSDKPLQKGFIGLQMNGGKIEFRNVFLKPLGGKPIFNKQDLAGWQVIEGSKSRFTIGDGTIHVENGPGFLQTWDQYGDFVLQGRAKTNGDRLNSGIFFRAMPGTEKTPSNGYEFQIQNGFEKNDRTQPADFGTGAIFRRVKARRVVPNDREWFSYTLVADGLTFATWVNGYPVVAWTDDRKPNENPRNGSRRQAGHLILQGHDPTTNLDFSDLSLSELPPDE